MYIWVAIDVDTQVQELRKSAELYIKSNGLSSPTLTLPFHVSLKISFQILDENREAVVEDILEFLKTLKPFDISVNEIEQNGPIVWLTMRNNEKLDYIHAALDALLFENHGVPLHEFDKEFIFHTSILILDSKEQSERAFSAIKNSVLPKELTAKRFIIGSSSDGQPGTYSVNEVLEF